MQNKIQILKADAGKSYTVGVLKNAADCVVLLYTDENIYLSDKFYTLSPKQCDLNKAYQGIYEVAHSKESYDYFILYTNLRETDPQLQEAIDMLSKMDIPCRGIMITCKP